MTDSQRTFLLWTVVLAPPVVWLFSFEALFALADWACIFQTKVTLYLVSSLALLLEAVLAALAWSQWKAWGGEWESHAAGPHHRARLMAIAGIVFSAGFAIVVISQAIPAVLLGACE
jgi:hypothetical protein